ncbi:MAG: BrnA antitoxin family protein [Candidatus Sulfotelmatobacter sp.]
MTSRQRREIAAIAAMKDEDIDLSDIPLTLDWSKAEIGRFYRPPKKAVAMRLDGDILKWLKGFGKGYQTKVNLLLRHAMESAVGRSQK